MLDQIKISSLLAMAKIGVYNWEQQIKQPLHLDIILFLDLKQCDDELTHTIDYSELCKRVTEYVESRSFKLIETVAEDIATLIKEHFSVEALEITVSKPHAIKNAKNISVTIYR